MRFCAAFVDEDRAASMVEYALLVALIAVVAFVAVAFAGEALSSLYGDIASTVADPFA